LLADRRRVVGVRARDTLGTRAIEISARLTINATGARIDHLLKPLGIATGLPMLKAMNLVTKRDAGDEALGGRSTTGRNLFLVPWRYRALFGTWESDVVCDPEDAGVAERDVAAFIAELNQAFPALDLTLPDGSIGDVGLAIADARREYDEGLPTDTIPHVIAAYGSRYRDVMEIATDRPDWRTRIARDSPVIGAELILAARKEMAPTLADIVIRRTPLGALGYPGDDPM